MKEEKLRLRALLRQRLALLRPAERLTASHSLLARILCLEIWQSAKKIALFAGRADEIETSLLWLEAFSGEEKFLYPRVAGQELEFVEVSDLATLQTGRWGISEPLQGVCTLPDLVLVPGLGFDAQGGRLGRGGGYYDRWLAVHPAVPTLGVCFDFQIVESIPQDPHDRKMDGVVTDKMVYLPWK